jgi:hypothetical protein
MFFLSTNNINADIFCQQIISTPIVFCLFFHFCFRPLFDHITRLIEPGTLKRKKEKEKRKIES